MNVRGKMFSASLLIVVLVLMLFFIVACSQNSNFKNETNTKKFELTSSAFENNGRIDDKYTKSNVNTSIPLSWRDAPKGTESFAVFMVDLHPVANNWVHWIVVDIPSNAVLIEEGASGTEKLPKGSRELNNSFSSKGYGGPQPPKGSGDHEYKTIIYALNVKTIDVPERITFADFQKLVEPAIIASAEISGFYENK